MKELIAKYRENRLTKEEITELRRRLEALSPEELQRVIAEDWEDYRPGDSPLPDGRKEEILEAIHQELKLTSPGRSQRVWNIARNIAALLLPFVMIAAVYFYLHPVSNPSLMCVTTGNGERARVSLPDGSSVTLNGSSSLSYNAGEFTTGKRHVDFSGEAFFDVAKDPANPFSVKAHGLNVTVVGTSFNLNAGAEAKEAVLFLRSGLVRLFSDKNRQDVTVRPGEKAVMLYRSGEIKVTKAEDNENITAWHSKKLFFNDESLSNVIATMERYYGRKITVEGTDAGEKLFTGMIPTDNLQLSIDVIERIFNVRLRIED